VATAWLRGTVGLEDFAPDRLATGDVAELRRRVRVGERALDGDAGAPWGAVVTVRCADGASDSETCRAPRGLPENPMSEAEVVAKARSLLHAAGLRDDETGAAVAAALALTDGGEPRNLTMAALGGDDDAGE
jgi:2-methylcitrate dehydratase PrpD